MTETQTQNDTRAIYRRRFSGREEYRARVWQTLISDYFSRFIPADGAVLDLGCGYGEFINNVDAPLRYAMDLNPDSREQLDPGVRLFQQDCSMEWPLKDHSLDLVFSSNFFEHLPAKSNLEATLRQAHRCLRPGGRLIALGPNIKYVHGAYWDFWDHHLPLTDASLSEVMQLIGFRVERVVPRFLPFTMANGPRYPMFVFRAYLRFSLTWRFFGKQFLVIACK